MKCLVTGASGQLGSYLVRNLLQQDAEVHVLVRPQSDLWRLSDVLDRIGVLRADLTDLSLVADELMALHPDAVFHLAWQGVSADSRNDPNQITSNVMGSLALFKTVQSGGCDCWVGVGSQAEYGPYSHALTEDLPTKPVTAYGVSKLCVGMLTKKLCELTGCRYLWFRLLATYGPKDDDRHLIPTTIRQLLAGERPALTPGDQKWDYLYVEDAAEAIARAAVIPQVTGVYNLGSEVAHSIRDTVERIRDMIDPSLPLGIGEIPYRDDQPMLLQADISKLTRATGWTPSTSLEMGLRRTLEWYVKEFNR